MTVYFQGAEIEDFICDSPYQNVFYVVNGTYYSWEIGAHYEEANVRGAVKTIGAPQGVHYVETTALPNISDFWLHAVVRFDDPWWQTYTAKNFIEMRLNGVGYLGFRLYGVRGTYSIEIFKYDSGTWTSIGLSTIGAFWNGARHTMDFRIKLGASGNISIYRNGYPIFSSALNLQWSSASVTGFDRIRFENVGTLNEYSTTFAEIIVADFNTIGSKLVVKTGDAAGTHNEWTGDYTLIDELYPSGSVTDCINSSTADQKFSSNVANFPSLTSGQSIESVKVIATALRDMDGPPGINLLLNINETLYESTRGTVNVAVSTFANTWAVNPATGLKWTQTDLNNLQIGVRSRT